MGLFNAFSSLIDGTFVDDLEKGIESFEKLVDNSTSAIDTVVDTATNKLDSVVDGVEKAANVADVVSDKLPE